MVWIQHSLLTPCRTRIARDECGHCCYEYGDNVTHHWLRLGALYQTENYNQVIVAMVEHHVAWTPTIAKWLWPLSSFAPRFWQKAQEFIRRFVAAGGILKEGSDPSRGMARLSMHEALAMDVEAGVPPMTVIQAATLNVAKTFKKDKDYGSVEPGKIADLSIVEGDPLQDIWMTQNVKLVVMNGKVVDHEFHKYVNPIPEFNSWQQLPEHIDVIPLAVTQNSGPITLTVKGKGFLPFHYVLLNGRDLETTFVSRSELKAIIPPDRSGTSACIL